MELLATVPLLTSNRLLDDCSSLLGEGAVWDQEIVGNNPPQSYFR
jgi:hypothetical protein